MADVQSTVVIKVKIDTDQLDAELAGMSKKFDRFGDRDNKIAGGARSLDNKLKRVSRSMGGVSRGLKQMTAGFGKLVLMMGKINFLAMAAELGVFTAGLLAIKLALITGRAAVSLYNIALKGLSVAAASVATGLSVAAAAMREFQEAQMVPFLGGGFTGGMKARRISRGMGARNMGLLGGQGAMQVASAQARGGFSGQNSASLVAALINAAGGADPAAISSVLKNTTVAGAVGAAQNLAGIRKGALDGISSFGGLGAALTGGGALKQGFGGTGETLANTFLGTVKTGFADMKGLFADIGMPMLEPMRQAFLQISNSLRENFLALQQIVQRFGADSMAPTMVTIFDRIMRFITENVIDHLGKIKEMGDNFVGFFKAMANFFRGMGSFLGQFEPAANVIIDMFKAGSKANTSSLFKDFSDLVVKHREGLMAFGTAVGNLFGGIFDMFSGGNRGFFEDGLPMLVDTMNALTEKLFPAFQNLWEKIGPTFDLLPAVIAGLATAINALAPFIGMFARAINALMGAMPTLVGLIALSTMGPGANMMGGAAKMLGINKASVKGVMSALGSKKIFAAKGAPVAIGRGIGIGGNFATGASMPVALGTYGQLATGLGGLAAMGGGAYMAATGGVEAFKTGRFTGKMAMGAGLGLAGASMAGLAVTGPVGAAIIATALLTEGLLAYFGNKKFKKDSKNAMKEALEEGRKSRAAKIATGEFGQEDFDALTKEKQLLERAMDAAVNDKGEFKMEGDTREFKEYLRFKDIDPNDIHRDAAFEEAVGSNELTRLIAEIGAAERRRANNLASVTSQTNASLEKLGASLRLTSEDVERLAQDLYGIDLHKGVSPLAGMMIAASQTIFSRNRGFAPDFSTSKMGINESMVSADKALLALRDDFNVDNLTAFSTAFSSYEVSRGMSSDIAGLSSIMEIEQQAERGVFGTNKAAALEAAGVAKAQIFAEMGSSYNIPSTKLREIYESGGMSGLEQFLGDQQLMRRGIAGLKGDMSHKDRLDVFSRMGVDLESQAGFKDSIGGAITAEQYNKLFGIGLGDDEFGGAGQDYFDSLDKGLVYEQVAAKAAGGDSAAEEIMRESMNNWMTDTGDLDANRNRLLETINDAVNKPLISVNGMETGQGSFTIEIGPNTGINPAGPPTIPVDL